ncbi:MAG: D-alanyl-D-alanine carboxypeptidase [Nitrospirae bacterium]|nr:D-alanyl-D-alanine carboxypeptidase [Nitrospirota bacterium]
MEKVYYKFRKSSVGSIYVSLSLFIFFFMSNSAYGSSIKKDVTNSITARSAVIIDVDSEKILYAKNPTLKQPPASTAKLVTAMVVLDNVNINEIVTVSKEASNLYCSAAALREGDRFYVKDLLYLLLVRSVNGAAVALAEAVSGSEEQFVQLMNKRAAHIGARDTKYVNPHGLPGEGQYITAYDLAIIMKEALRYPLIKDIINTKTKTVTSIDGKAITVANTNKLLWSDDDLVGGKTGYTKEARHCLAFAAERGDSTLVAAVLGDNKRSALWHSARNVLSKGYYISSTNTEPVIYYSKINDERINNVAVHKLKSGHHKKKSSHIKSRHRRVRDVADNVEIVKHKDKSLVAKKSKPHKHRHEAGEIRLANKEGATSMTHTPVVKEGRKTRKYSKRVSHLTDKRTLSSITAQNTTVINSLHREGKDV